MISLRVFAIVAIVGALVLGLVACDSEPAPTPTPEPVVEPEEEAPPEIEEEPATASIGDFVWHDTDQDGIQDDPEPAMPQVAVELYDSDDTLVASATTGPDGRYLFTNVAPGEYYVRFTLPATYLFTQQDQGDDDSVDSDADPTSGETVLITLDPGETDLTWDAGMIESQPPTPTTPPPPPPPPTPEPECDTDEDCPDGVCDHGECVECNADADCPDGWCDEDVCVEYGVVTFVISGAEPFQELWAALWPDEGAPPPWLVIRDEFDFCVDADKGMGFLHDMELHECTANAEGESGFSVPTNGWWTILGRTLADERSPSGICAVMASEWYEVTEQMQRLGAQIDVPGVQPVFECTEDCSKLH